MPCKALDGEDLPDPSPVHFQNGLLVVDLLISDGILLQESEREKQLYKYTVSRSNL